MSQVCSSDDEANGRSRETTVTWTRVGLRRARPIGWRGQTEDCCPPPTTGTRAANVRRHWPGRARRRRCDAPVRGLRATRD